VQPTNPGGGSLQILLFLAFLITAIFFLRTQHNTLKTIKPGNRLMNPGLVWLQLIPFFGQLWQFLVVTLIANSMKKEFESRQDDSILGFSDAAAVEQLGKRPTLIIGIVYCTLTTLTVILNLGPVKVASVLNGSAYTVSALCSLSGMTCWIIYWVQLAGYKRTLRQGATSPA
jgi:hypothetical protein